MTAPTRPLMEWHGGKWRLADWIIRQFPPHAIYDECFGGAASVLLRKPRAEIEVYNDLNEEAVSLFRVLRDPALSERLRTAVDLTPYAKVEYDLAYGPPSADPVENARRMIYRSFAGRGGDSAMSQGTFRRRKASPQKGGPASSWRNYPDTLAAVIERLRGVSIECEPAIDLMRRYDDPDTLHYVDPPYVHETRRDTGLAYAVEMDDAEHAELLAFLDGLAGMVALSGYPSKLYDQALQGWDRRDWIARDNAGKQRIECLWLNPACVERARQPDIFGGT